jgi:lysophospholipase L1-like esterase
MLFRISHMKHLPLCIALLLSTAPLAAQPVVSAFGDSITWGYNLTDPPTESWPAIVAKARGWALVNTAAQGTQAEDEGQAVTVFRQTITPSSKSLLLSGYNDMRMWGTNDDGLETYEGTLRAMLVWLGTPATRKITAQSPMIMTWPYEAWHLLNTSLYPEDLGIFTTDKSGTASTTASLVYGTTIYVTSMKLGSGGGSFTVSVDDTDFGTFSCNGARMTNNGTSYAPFVVRIPNLRDGLHAVAIRAASPGPIYLLAISGNGGLSNDGAEVWVGNCLSMKTYDFNGSATAVRRYNDVIDKVVRELRSDGFNIGFADVSASYHPATMVSADNVHPNKAGHRAIAQAFLQAMKAARHPDDHPKPSVSDTP